MLEVPTDDGRGLVAFERQPRRRDHGSSAVHRFAQARVAVHQRLDVPLVARPACIDPTMDDVDLLELAVSVVAHVRKFGSGSQRKSKGVSESVRPDLRSVRTSVTVPERIGGKPSPVRVIRSTLPPNPFTSWARSEIGSPRPRCLGRHRPRAHEERPVGSERDLGADVLGVHREAVGGNREEAARASAGRAADQRQLGSGVEPVVSPGEPRETSAPTDCPRAPHRVEGIDVRTSRKTRDRARAPPSRALLHRPPADGCRAQCGESLSDR